MTSEDFTRDICNAVEQGFEKQLELTADLVRVPSLSGSEREAQSRIVDMMTPLGLKIDRWQADLAELAGHPGSSPAAPGISPISLDCVVGSHIPDVVTGRSLILNGHIDVVPPGARERWTSPPYEPTVKGGWLYGRGAADMKSGLIACLGAYNALRTAGLAPAAPVYIQSVAEEECTGNGTVACLARGYKADLAIIPEPSNEAVVRAQAGVIWVHIDIKGDPQHASGSSGFGSSAIDKAWTVANAVGALQDEWNAEKASHHPFEKLSCPININLGKVEGGDWVSTVPSSCTVSIRVGIYADWSIDEAWRRVEDRVRLIAKSDDYLSENPPVVRCGGFKARGYVVEGAQKPLDLLNACHAEVFGGVLQEIVTPATSDARTFGLYGGFPALVYGATGRNIHSFDEAVDIASLMRVTKVLALFIARWCGVTSFQSSPLTRER